MDEKEWADRFNSDLDNMLNSKKLPDVELTPTEYRRSVDLARTLTETDFSILSRIKKPLRYQLMNKSRKEITMMNIWKRNPRLRLMSIVLASTLIALLIGSGAFEVAAKSLVDFVQSLRVGDYSWIQQTESSEIESTKQDLSSTATTVEYKGDIWILRTAIGNFGGDALPGRNPAVQRFNSMSEAQTVAPFDIRQPNFLPADYEFQEVMVTPMDWVFLFYRGPNGDLVLAQLPVGKVSGNEADHQITPVAIGQLTTVGVGMLADKQIESVTLNGQLAGWIDGTGLMWEADGISFTVGGPNLTREEIMQIAESLE